jgi:hypothetical protein
VVMVVSDTRLVKGRRSRRLNPPEETFLHKHPKSIIDRLF